MKWFLWIPLVHLVVSEVCVTTHQTRVRWGYSICTTSDLLAVTQSREDMVVSVENKLPLTVLWSHDMNSVCLYATRQNLLKE